MKNPFAVLPEATRLYLYLILVIAFLALTAWQASGGDWGAAALTFVGSLGSLMAASNTGESTNPFRLSPKE